MASNISSDYQAASVGSVRSEQRAKGSRLSPDHGRVSETTKVSPAAAASNSSPSAAEIKRVVQQLRQSALAGNLEFSVDESSGRTVVKITDPVTHEVIRQIPSEETLQISKALERMDKGVLLNKKA